MELSAWASIHLAQPRAQSLGARREVYSLVSAPVFLVPSFEVARVNCPAVFPARSAMSSHHNKDNIDIRGGRNLLSGSIQLPKT